MVAISGGETRGISPISFSDLTNQYMSFLTIHGNASENLEFRMVKADMSEQVLLLENEQFSNNLVLGTLDSPYRYECYVTEGDCPTIRDISTLDMQVAQSQVRYQAAIRLSSSGIIDGQRSVEFISGREVIIEPGFEVMPLSTLDIRIEDCISSPK